MYSDEASAEQSISRLEHFPVSFFGASMGVLGLGLALRASGFHGLSYGVGIVAALVLVALLGVTLLKAIRYPAAMVEEWNHPVRLAFFPAISISILLFATLIRETHPQTAHILWSVGALAQAILTIVVISAWISHRAFVTAQLSPAWFIPAVGNVIVPLAGVPLGYIEISWYFLSVGILFWIILATLVFNRLIFHDPLPGKLRPTLVILIAPPAVAFLAWLQLNGGELDALARVLINCGYFFLALVAVQGPALLKLPFALSFWALSFPMAAITTASFRFADLSGSAFHEMLGFALLGLLCLIIIALTARTVRAMMREEICVPE